MEGSIWNKAFSYQMRRLTIYDLETLVLWMNDPRIHHHMHIELPITIENTRNWFFKNQGSNSRADLVLCDDVGDIVAFCGITRIDVETRKGELYTFVNPFKHNRGIGTIAKKLMLRYAFEVLHLNKVYSIVNEENKPSSKINEKLGFILEGKLRQEYKNQEGEFKDRLYYGLLNEEFQLDE